MDRFEDAFGSADPDAVVELFAPDGWLRDRLALSWDLRTFHGEGVIRGAAADHVNRHAPWTFGLDDSIEPALVGEADGRQWVQAAFRFEMTVGRGRGFVRLIASPERGAIVAWTVLLELTEIKGHEEASGSRRPHGVTHGSVRQTENWLDRRRRRQEFVEADPTVLVIGAGQSGLSVAARLEHLGIDTLVLERQKRVGDSWRNRYHSLVLHDPIWANHLPYLQYPESWPRFIPKDKLADWFEAYASIMELNVWTESELREASYDDEEQSWTVRIARGEQDERVLSVRHIVLASGHSGLPRVPSLAGAYEFRGKILHSSEYRDAADFSEKRVVVVGAGNSGHDIAHDLVEAGAEVTMVQRSQTYVMSSENGFEVLHGGVYEQDGLSLDDADLLANSLPLPVVFDLHREQATPVIAEKDRELLDGLRRAGFSVDDDHGILELYLTVGGKYYIEVGASAAIIEGRINVKSRVEIDHLTADEVVYTDGSRQGADVVILATGYGDMTDVARQLLGDAVAERCGPVWGLDAEGEMNGVWRGSGHPGLWFMGGNLGLVRAFSKTLALQIKAAEIGLLERH